MLFELVCFLIMLPMIFSVPILYVGMLGQQGQEKALLGMTVAIFVAIGCWFAFGNQLIGGANLLFGSVSNIITGLVQMEFYLYAIVMLIGTIVVTKGCRYFMGFVPLWTLLVYCPIAYLIWNDQGWLRQMGALDFSGGIVVHLTAGLTSLVLSRKVTPVNDPIRENDFRTKYAATLMIMIGWLGFNLAPAGHFNQLANLVLVNTLIAVIGAMIGWLLFARLVANLIETDDLLNGIICGLVTSTCLVGYVRPLEIGLVTFVAGIACPTVIAKMNQSVTFYDAVDSFAMNAIGGLVGVGGLMLIKFGDIFNQPEQTSRLILAESLAVIIATAVTVIGTMIAHQIGLLFSQKLLLKFKFQGESTNE